MVAATLVETVGSAPLDPGAEMLVDDIGRIEGSVVVIEHDAFRDLWSSELDGGLVVAREDADKIEAGAVTVFPDEGKRRYDIAIPQLTRALARSETALDRLNPSDALPGQPSGGARRRLG